MLEQLKTDVLNRLYAHPNCDHEALLLALVAYKTDDIPDDTYYSIIDNLNIVTNQTWQIEVL